MRAVVQRVRRAWVEVDERRVGEIERGLVVFLGVGQGDEERDAQRLAEKIAHLRIFEDEQGRMNESLLQQGGSVLAVSNFTLYGDCRKGRRPNFTQAARPEEAEPLFERFVEGLRSLGVPVATGRFGTRMRVMVENDGPVTLLLSSGEEF
jgi:D-tyrosyl-tRNA(Tyr) deacylase